MPGITPPPAGERWRFLQWPFVWSLAVLAFLLGLAGYARLPHDTPETLLDHLYSTLQLFVLNATFAGPLNWQLEIARFLAPAVMAYTAAQALIVLFREQFTLLRLRFTRGHVVVCGLGRKGFKVASDFRRRGEAVVIIEEDDENDWIPMCKEIGATVLVGDATDSRLLAQARVQHARLLVAVCGDDGTNVETVIRASELKKASAPSGTDAPLECHVHIVESDLRALFKEHRVFTDTAEGVRIALFNIYDSSARLLLRRHPLDREHVGPDDPRTVHLLIIGFGLMGESLLLQAARTSHFANGRHLRVTVIDRDPSASGRRFMRRHPHFTKVCDVEFLAREADDAAALDEIAGLCADPAALPTVAICFDDDTRGLSLALALLPRLKPHRVPVLLRMTTDGGLTTLLDAGIADSRLSGLVKPFPVIGLSSESEVLLHREMDAIAVAIHSDYVARRRADSPASDDPSLRPWDQLDEDLKDSCRLQADHGEVKLRAVGLRITDDKARAPVTAFTPEEVEVLSKMEHDRWNADRFLAGWSYAPGKKDVEKKTSPWLVGWDALPDEIREYDREAVRNVPRFVELTGRRVCRS
ncbi:MAG: NAD-binding protein [Verrucomicrobiaceae bacterium]|nr:NAD-binding protein [Verrucomicrobiaceae bacterium]